MEWLSYLLKVSACMALFYAFYHLCLQRLTFFSVNRIYLLSTLIISFVIPAMQLQVQQSAMESVATKEDMAVHTSTLTDLRNGALASPNSLPQAIEDKVSINWQEILFFCYWLIAGILFGMFAFQALQLLEYTRKVNQKIGRLKVIFKSDGFTNCSFLNYVFVNQQELSEEEMKVILQHEEVHIERYHSVDKLLISACKALLWFNPLVYLYDRALEQVHEYEADKETSMAMGNTLYADLLLAMAVKKNNPSLTHSFVQNPLKWRIKMLFTNQSKNMKKLTYLTVLPIGLALTWTFAVQLVYANNPLNAGVPSSNASKTKELILDPAPSQNELRVEPNKSKKPQTDTLRLIDAPNLGKNPEVIIDGKTYDADILTKISPRCVNVRTSYVGKIELTTVNNKIEYATAIDRENVRARNKATASGKFYVRFTQRNQDGSPYDEIQIKLERSSGSVGLPKGSKLLLIIDGKQYTEAQAKELTAGQFSGLNIMRTTDIINSDLKATYGTKYKALIQISRSKDDAASDTSGRTIQPDGKKVFRRPIGMKIEDGYGKFSYSVQDSTIYIKGLGDVMLYGDVKMSNDQISIKADKVKFNGTDHIALAKNVSFTQKGKAEVKDVPFVRFNLRAGTYKVLQEIKGF